ncbi:GLPGLI family protein [candidate division KSB1 bacterium]|nr:GLPGLI family protein [candidate division KSB1 bacterium]
MKRSILIQCVSASILIMVSSLLSAGDIEGGAVRYQHITKYDFHTVFAQFDGPKVKDWLASLPPENKGAKVLAFIENRAHYGKDPWAKDFLPQHVKEAQMKADYVQRPKSNLIGIYYDFEKNEMIRQIEFMSRDFMVTDEITIPPWKLTTQKTKILNYLCMSAELEDGDRKIRAYFTPEIPFSVGPDEFFGLPGLILAVEINGETVFLAQSVDLTLPDESVLSKPDKGKRSHKISSTKS